MPVYLGHGFRWPRDGFAGIRVHAIVNNLEDVSVEYIQNPRSRDALLTSLRTLHPSLLKPLEAGNRRLDFLEQYDPEDLSASAVSQPYAFVCDWIVMLAGGTEGKAEHYSSQLLQTQAILASNRTSHAGSTSSLPQSPRVRAKTQPMSIAAPFNSPATITALSLNVEEIKAETPPLTTEAWEALADLRDKLADGEKIGWWVIYNGDPDRYYEPSEDSEASDGEDVETETGETSPQKETEKEESTPALSSVPNTLRPLEATPQETTEGMRSPTGGRMPPPIPPLPPATTPRSPMQTASKAVPIMISQSNEGTKPSAKEPPKSPTGLRKKIFGSKK